MGQLTKTTAEVQQALDEQLDGTPAGTFVWDDFPFSVTNTRVNPTTSKPDYDFTNGEYLFDAASTETIIGSNITKHKFKKGVSGLEWRPHIHWAQSAAGTVVWQLEYQLWNIRETEPSFTTIQSNGVVETYSSGTIHQISTFPAIDVSSIDTTACIVTIRVSRLGADASDTYAVDARFKGFDFHVPIDQIGSRQEFIK